MNDTLTTVLGGIELTVPKLDGTTETVKLSQLRLRDAQRYLAAASSGDEEQLVCIFTGKDKAWLDTLAPATAEQLLIEGEKLNQDFIMRSVTRADTRRDLIKPGFEEKAMKMLVDRLAASFPTLPSKPAAPSTNSPTAPSPK